MLVIQHMESKGTSAVKRLRRQKLAKGFPFMINDSSLPSTQCYLEQPNGSMQLVTLASGGKDFAVLRTLTAQESRDLRLKYGLAD